MSKTQSKSKKDSQSSGLSPSQLEKMLDALKLLRSDTNGDE